MGVNERADCVATSLAVQPDGSIVIAGCATTLPRGAFTGDDLVLARLTSDGRLDETFGTGGWLQLSLGMSSKANAVVLEPDGHIVACGFVRSPVAVGGESACFVSRAMARSTAASVWAVSPFCQARAMMKP